MLDGMGLEGGARLAVLGLVVLLLPGCSSQGKPGSQIGILVPPPELGVVTLDEQMYLLAITSASPAAAAGVQPGDRLIAVGEDSVADRTEARRRYWDAALRRILCGISDVQAIGIGVALPTPNPGWM
jgi:membrane-associated protease RseP (regulator of RpoE activity)